MLTEWYWVQSSPVVGAGGREWTTFVNPGDCFEGVTPVAYVRAKGRSHVVASTSNPR